MYQYDRIHNENNAINENKKNLLEIGKILPIPKLRKVPITPMALNRHTSIYHLSLKFQQSPLQYLRVILKLLGQNNKMRSS